MNNQSVSLTKAYMTIAVMLLLDQVTKIYVSMMIPLGQSVGVVWGLNLTHVQNTGVAFSMLSGVAGLGFFSLAACVYFLYQMHQRHSVWQVWANVCLIAGALGNVIDRLTVGSVTDFIDIYYQQWHWAIFNVADILICIGALIWIWDQSINTRKPESNS